MSERIKYGRRDNGLDILSWVLEKIRGTHQATVYSDVQQTSGGITLVKHIDIFEVMKQKCNEWTQRLVGESRRKTHVTDGNKDRENHRLSKEQKMWAENNTRRSWSPLSKIIIEGRGEEGRMKGRRGEKEMWQKNRENFKYSLSTSRNFYVRFCKMTFRYR